MKRLLNVCMGVAVFLSLPMVYAASMDSPIVEPEQADVTGTAKTLQGTVLYREYHQLSATAHRVDYQWADGKWLAHKNIQYDQIGGIVSFDLYYPDFQRTETVASGNGDISIDIKTRKKDINHQLVYKSGDAVDAGFDRLIRSRWQILMKGENLKTRFLHFRRGIWVSMDIRQTNNQTCQEMYGGEVDTCLKVRPSSFFLRMIVPDLYLAYNNKQQLVMYVGPSNLQFEDNMSDSLIITYQYASDSLSI